MRSPLFPDGLANQESVPFLNGGSGGRNPQKWNLEDLEDKLEDVIINYSNYKHIAENGQELYKKSIQDPFIFINALKRIVE